MQSEFIGDGISDLVKKKLASRTQHNKLLGVEYKEYCSTRIDWSVLLSSFFGDDWKVVEDWKNAKITIKLAGEIPLGALVQFSQMCDQYRSIGVAVYIKPLEWWDRLMFKRWKTK